MNSNIAEQALNDLSSDVERKDSTHFCYESEAPLLKANIKESAEDFQVSEKLKFELSGQGQHLCLFIEKKFLNTQDALNILSRFFKVPPLAIGYFGLKDKVAITRQWFSIDLASSQFDESHCEIFQTEFPQLLAKTMRAQNDPEEGFKRHPAQMKILDIKRNSKKFKIGQLAGNHFEIVLRNIGKPLSYFNVDGGEKLENTNTNFTKDMQQSLEMRLEYIKNNGFPNYFGEQRFGRDNHNIELLKRNIHSDLSKRRALRARIISTLRALVFNRYLSERIESHNARAYIEGDVLQFSDGNTLFHLREQDSADDIQKRLKQGEIVISGPLVGVDKSLASGKSLEFEEVLLRKFRTYSPILERFKVNSGRRSLFAQATNFTWYFSDNDLFLNFDLAAGSFATSLVRELVNFRNNKVVE